jgi:hypothetical protein
VIGCVGGSCFCHLGHFFKDLAEATGDSLAPDFCLHAIRARFAEGRVACLGVFRRAAWRVLFLFRFLLPCFVSSFHQVLVLVQYNSSKVWLLRGVRVLIKDLENDDCLAMEEEEERGLSKDLKRHAELAVACQMSSDALLHTASAI